MKHKVIFLLMIIALISVIGCDLGNQSLISTPSANLESPSKGDDSLLPSPTKIIKDVGTIRYIKTGEGLWIIVGKSGRYLPENLPRTFMKNGLEIGFTAKALSISSDIRMWGRPISLITMISQNPKYPAVLDQAIIDTVTIQGNPWLLKGKTDTYQALNLPEKYMIPGLKVSVAGLIRDDIIIIPPLWPLLEVKEISPLSEMPQIIGLGDKFKLAEGKQVLEPKARILFTFLEVLADSRCPINARCIWQGEAVVAVNININNIDYGNFKLSTLAPNSSIQVGGYNFQFLDLAPYPSLPVEAVPKYTGVFVINPLVKQ